MGHEFKRWVNGEGIKMTAMGAAALYGQYLQASEEALHMLAKQVGEDAAVFGKFHLTNAVTVPLAGEITSWSVGFLSNRDQREMERGRFLGIVYVGALTILEEIYDLSPWGKVGACGSWGADCRGDLVDLVLILIPTIILGMNSRRRSKKNEEAIDTKK